MFDSVRSLCKQHFLYSCGPSTVGGLINTLIADDLRAHPGEKGRLIFDS